jgi:predicted dienelactone hydrolase
MRRNAVAAAAALVAFVAAACGDGSNKSAAPASSAAAAPATTTSTTVDLDATYDVEQTTFKFVDKSRPTDDPNKVRSAPTRTLVTWVWVPRGKGPFPLIVHAHGAAGHPRKFTQLLGGWARHGFVVAAPVFPLSNDESGGPVVVGDYPNQALDMRFALRQLLATADEPGNALSGKVDAQHVGMSGLSLGGATTYGAAFNDCCRDSHVKAAIIMSGIKVPFHDEPFHFAGTPILIMHGTDDPQIPYRTAPEAYQAAAPPKYFVTLIGAGHAPPYEDAPDPHDRVVEQVTLDFWNAYLRGDDESAQQLVTDAQVPNLSSIAYKRA